MNSVTADVCQCQVTTVCLLVSIGACYMGSVKIIECQATRLNNGKVLLPVTLNLSSYVMFGKIQLFPNC